MHKRSNRLSAMLLAVLLVFTQPVLAGALDGGNSVLVDEVILTDGMESPQLTLQSFESTSGGTGSLYSTMTVRQKACYNALKDISFSTILSSPNYSVPVNISGIRGAQLTGTSDNGKFVATGASAAVYSAMFNDMNAAITALRYDRPDLLWLEYMVGSQFYFKGSNNRYTISEVKYRFYLPYHGQENVMRDRMMAEARSIANEASKQKDMYSKVKKAYDMLAARSTYNWSAYNMTASTMEIMISHSPYSALLGGDGYEPVCDGYSKAFKIVMNLMDIPCAVPVSDDHMWNNVKMDDGLWYNVDLTWDDIEGRPTAGTTYFLVGSGTKIYGVPFSSSHVEHDPFNESRVSGDRYPKKNTKAYNYIGEDYPKPTYPDVLPGAYYYGSVELVSKLGYFYGDNRGNFNPAKKITRAEFATVIARVLNVDTSQYRDRYSFPDVSTGKWCSGAIYWAKENGIMIGSKGKFRPSDPISRQEMCTVLARAFGLEGSTDELFPDDGSIAGWARQGVYACRAAGLVKGVTSGDFKPKGNTVRGDAAIVFARYAELIGAVPSGGQ